MCICLFICIERYWYDQNVASAPWGEDYNGQLVDLFLPHASGPPQTILIISHPEFIVLFSFLASPFHIIISSLKYLQAFGNPTWCYLLFWNHVENISLSLSTYVKDDTSLPLTDEFCIFGGTWAAPVIPNMWLKTNQTKDLFTGAPFSALSCAWGINLFLHGMGGTCFCCLVMLWRC